MNRDTRLVALALLLWGFGEGFFLYIQPLYIEQLGANPIQIGGLLSAMSVMSAVTFLPAGALADRLPRKWVMWGGWVLGLAAVLLVGLARTWQGLIPGLLLSTANEEQKDCHDAQCLSHFTSILTSRARESKGGGWKRC